MVILAREALLQDRGVLGMGLAFVLVQVLAVREKQLGVAQDKAIRVVDGVGRRLLGIVLTAEAVMELSASTMAPDSVLSLSCASVSSRDLSSSLTLIDTVGMKPSFRRCNACRVLL